MANVFAVKNGVWSDTTLWNTSALPITADDVFSNNFTIYVDGNYQVLTVQNLSATGINFGGRFILNDTVSLTANVIGGTTDVNCVQFLSAAPAFCTIVGSLCANNPAGRAGALLNNSTGTVTVIGNGLGRIKNSPATLPPVHGYINNQSSGTINLFGNYFTSPQQVSDNRTIWNDSTGTINLVGSLTGNAGGEGIYNNSTGTINVTGSVTGNGIVTSGDGIRNVGAGIVKVIGTVNGGIGFGIRNAVGGSVTVIGTVVGGTGSTGAGGGIVNSGTGPVTVVGVVSGGSGSASNNSNGIYNASSGVVSVTGDIVGRVGTGLNNNSTGTVNIIGNIRSTGAGIGLSISNGNVSVLGNVITGPSNYGILIASGFLSLTGNVIGGTGPTQSMYGIYNGDFGYVTVYGNVSGGAGTFAAGIQNGQGTALYCTAVVYGDVFGGAGSGAPGVNQIGRYSQAYIYGNAYGGIGSGSAGVSNNPAGGAFFTYVQGNAYGGLGSTAFGVLNGSGGFAYIQGSAVGNGFGLNSTAAGISQAVQGVSGPQNGITIVGGLSCGSRGLWPTLGNVFVRPIANSTCSFRTSAFQDISIFTSLSANIVPPVSSVRSGTVFNLGDFRGTCGMPSISSVLQGISADNSIGIVALQPQTIWDYSVLSATDVNSLGGRLKDVATVQSVGQQLTALN
jgi:hypothetical protein